jgi:uncharacterized membrane protein YccC
MPATDASQANSESSTQATPQVPVKFRFAVKTALSLTLAYLIPMAMGWPQPQTAATTVMLIAATGMLSESLQKGVLRVLGTVAGAIVGLTLIALFPQDRTFYLLAVSLVVSFIIYLYNAYQGDSTLFMLAAVVTLMVFNGGDAEGAFLYGVDRAFMTVFGVLVYTLVASLLWPVRTEDNTHALAANVATALSGAFARLVAPPEEGQPPVDELLAGLMASQDTFQTQLAVTKNNRDAVAAYLAEWNTVASCYQDLESLLVPDLKQQQGRAINFEQYIDGYPGVIRHIEGMFGSATRAWQGEVLAESPQVEEVTITEGSLRSAPHLTVAAVATRLELLQKIQAILVELNLALGSLLFDRGGSVSGREPRGQPSFIWLDLENVKTALRALVTFWIACGIWIQFNPPGGFTFVTLCTVLIPLVSYTPVTPKLLFILFTLGFFFAVPAYVFLLPAMTHWLELGVFLFAYAFLGFYVLKGPVAIFFLLGLFTLGIQNTMNYAFNGLMLTILMFYMICALLIISVHFPFTSKPEKIYASLRRRFFLHCGRLAMAAHTPRGFFSWWTDMRIRSGNAVLGKMHHWGAMIDSSYFPSNGQEQIQAFNQSCDLLLGQLQVLYRRAGEFNHNPLVRASDRRARANSLMRLCNTLALGGSEQTFEQSREGLADIEQRLDEHLGSDSLQRFQPSELAQFYVYLNLQVSIQAGLHACREAQNKLDLEQLRYARF